MKRFFLIILCMFYLVSCSVYSSVNNEKDETEMLSLATWNVQTFFDSEIEGTEYSDFQNLAKWSKDKYLTRLSRLCEVMTTLNADIFVLEEIENAAVVQDISNLLAGKSWEKNKNWGYACFAREAEGSIGCAVFSRYELRNLQIHSMCVKSQGKDQPNVRPLMQVTVDVSGKELIVFVNHWKSKSGGEAESEIWRDWQESVIADSLGRLGEVEEELACILCGDFNRDAREFAGDYPTVLLRGCGYEAKVYSPWFNASGDYATDTGSYFYNGEWERIDHIFAVGKLRISAFGPKTDGVWCSSGGIPEAYKLYSGEGYSDHLPLMCVITLE